MQSFNELSHSNIREEYSVRLVLTWSVIGIFFLIDQFCLPMFHYENLSFKFSYLFFGLWFLKKILYSNHDHLKLNKEKTLFFLLFLIIILFGIIGEVWISNNFIIDSNDEIKKSSAIYIISIFSFFLGIQCKELKLNWLVIIFYISASLNLLFSLFREYLPVWLMHVYYFDDGVFDKSGFGTVEEIVALARPRGLFGNPNVSALLLNLNTLFIHLCLRNSLFVIRSYSMILGIVFLPILISTLFASRGEFVISLIIGFLNYRYYFKSLGKIHKTKFTLISLIFFIGLMIWTASVLNKDETVKQGVERIEKLSNSFDNNNDDGTTGNSRLMIFSEVGAVDRFWVSPFVGSGFASANYYPFDGGTRYFHNDWARMMVTSGILGTLAMLYLIKRFALPLGWPAILPFFIPALTNSFMLCIPAFTVYWFMVACLREKCLIQTSQIIK